MKLVEMICPNCGDKLVVNPNLPQWTCNSCGATFREDKNETIITKNININKNIRNEEHTYDHTEIEANKIRLKVAIVCFGFVVLMILLISIM